MALGYQISYHLINKPYHVGITHMQFVISIHIHIPNVSVQNNVQMLL